MPEHLYDKGYKRVLSSKRNFLHFMKKYIRVNWMQNITEDDLTLIDKAFIDERFKEKEADLVYRVRQGGEEVYFYVLLELQSTCDYTMPFRLLCYMVELMKRIFQDTDPKVREHREFRMPAVIPVILYNGRQPWTAVRSFKEYTAQAQRFEDSVVDFRYLMLDLKRVNDAHMLDTNTALDDILYLERGSTDQDFVQSLLRITKRIPAHTHEDILALWDWLIDVLSEKMSNPALLEETKQALLKGDVEKMTTNLERILDDKYWQGKQAGRQEGELEGEHKAKMEMAKKFLSEGVEPRLVERCTGIPLAELKKLQNDNREGNAG